VWAVRHVFLDFLKRDSHSICFWVLPKPKDWARDCLSARLLAAPLVLEH